VNRTTLYLPLLLIGISACFASTAVARSGDPKSADDGWQVLSPVPAASSSQVSPAEPPTAAATQTLAAQAAHKPAVDSSSPSGTMATPTASTPVQPDAVVIGPPVAEPAATVPASESVLQVTAHDLSIHNALQKWLAAQGWQLAWEVPDELPIEYQATFREANMKQVLWDLMATTNHMKFPARACRHMANNVVRVIERADSCKE
jgi:Toxin co-regulated pilus biosynthesis protein Q